MSPVNQYCIFSLCGCGFSSSGIRSLIAVDNPNNSQILLLYAFAVVIIIYSIIMVRRRAFRRVRGKLREREQALDEIEQQKLDLELRSKDLTDSLIYAQKIQEAILPSEEYFQRHFRDSFIFFKPKDIVSGDFYWIDNKGDKIFVVAADCTGHGVPGALLSMIGHKIIEKTINEDNIEKPAAVLQVMNRSLEKTFSREKNIGTIIRDGMDIGLCVIDKKRRKLEYSGAFFPLYLFRENTLTEISGDKIIIGMNPEGLEYTSHQLDLLDDDILYIFSDGYVDQFGGTDNKKFMYRRFRYLLTTIHRFPLDAQKAILEENITAWMADNPQVDDMMVLGFRPLS